MKITLEGKESDMPCTHEAALDYMRYGTNLDWFLPMTGKKFFLTSVAAEAEYEHWNVRYEFQAQ